MATGARNTLDSRELDLLLRNRGLVCRMLGSRVRNLPRSSWHMAPIGFLLGLGLETASEVTLLTLSASPAAAGAFPAAALLTLPLLFASGMSAMDTADSLLMIRAYSWAQRNPARRLYYNLATTAMTVLVGGFVASVYLAGPAEDHLGAGWLAGYASIADHFERLGYGIVGRFAASWVAAVLVWRRRGYEHRFAPAGTAPAGTGRKGRTGEPGGAFPEPVRAGPEQVIAARRDIRRLRAEPVPAQTLTAVLRAGHLALWSCAAAIENMWLIARAHGLGLGWVTLFRPEEPAALLALPDGVQTLGWLCLGWPDEARPSRDCSGRRGPAGSPWTTSWCMSAGRTGCAGRPAVIPGGVGPGPPGAGDDTARCTQSSQQGVTSCDAFSLIVTLFHP